MESVECYQDYDDGAALADVTAVMEARLADVAARMQRLRTHVEAVEAEKMTEAAALRSSPFRAYRFGHAGSSLQDVSAALRHRAIAAGAMHAGTGLVQVGGELAAALGVDAAEAPCTPFRVLALALRHAAGAS